MWTVVYVASGWKEAETIKNRLAQDGLLVMLRACCANDEKLAKHVELLVPAIEAKEAQAIILQMRGATKGAV